MRLSRFVLLLSACLCYLMAHGQVDVEQIKTDFRYWSAEGHGTTIDEADKDALGQISRQIAISILSKSDDTHIGQGGQDYYVQESTIKAYSFASLQNVSMIVLEPEPNARVFRWVAKSEVDKMFELRKQKILDYVESGRKAEQRLQIDDALRCYYWALMLATAHQDAKQPAVYTDFNGDKENSVASLPKKIKSVISNIKVRLDDCFAKDNRYVTTVRFSYDGHDVASVQFRYFDGQSYVGPLTAKDGVGELELLSLPADKKVKIQYEYAFRKEAEGLDSELMSVFASGRSAPTIDNALVELPVKVDLKKNVMAEDKKYKEGVSAPVTDAAVADMAVEPISQKRRMELDLVKDTPELANILQQVENAIAKGSPQDVYTYFTPEGYKLFETLLTKTGKVSLAGKSQTYEFVRANGQILGRFCKIKIKFRKGKTYMENIVFRFDENSRKIQSIALALTKKAEDDIFNAAATWPEISRFTILQFMEDYQTAYFLKRLDYIDKIFSDDAIIISGVVLKKASREDIEGMPIDFGRQDVLFKRETKTQFLSKLKRHFNDREYIHLTFEDNQTKVINAPRIPKGTAFAIQINQMYNSEGYDSPGYSDRGYLTLVLDASKKLPIIHVRYWEPEQNALMTLDEFMQKWSF